MKMWIVLFTRFYISFSHLLCLEHIPVLLAACSLPCVYDNYLFRHLLLLGIMVFPVFYYYDYTPMTAGVI